VNLLLIALGGAIGSIGRYGTSLFAQRIASIGFPLGTFLVNVAGCAVLGLLSGWAQSRGGFSAEARAFLFVGVLGGFTTFSTFGVETLELLRAGRPGWAAFNVAGQVGTGLIGIWIGFAFGSRL
jgi:CrcB protein